MFTISVLVQHVPAMCVSPCTCGVGVIQTQLLVQSCVWNMPLATSSSSKSCTELQLCCALSSCMWSMLSKRCCTLHLTSLAAVCRGTMYYIASKKQPSLKTLQKVDGCWEELWGRSSVSRQRGSTGAACCAQPVVCGKSSRSYRFCEFALPSSLSPLTYICFYLYFSACVIGVNVCESWILNFVGNRPVTLLLQDCFYSTSKFPELKENEGVCFEAYVWDSTGSH